MHRGTNLPRMEEFNQTVILDTIRRAESGLSRAQVARRTGLSAQTVTNISRRLLNQGLIVEGGGIPRPGPGRPGTRMRLNPKGRYAVGVHLDPAVITIVILDLTGTVVATSQRRTPAPDRPDEAVAGIVADVQALIATSGIDRARILGVGIAAPGPIDVAAGLVLDPPHLPGWHQVPLRDEIARQTGLEVVLDKDVIAAASAHVWTRTGHDSSDFAFVYLGTGVAVSVVLRAEVVRGVSGNAGESGHIVVDSDGPLCSCGQHGCLGACVSAEALVDQLVAAGLSLPAGMDNADPRQTYEALQLLASGADRGDDRALAVLRTAGRRLGMGAAMVCDLLDLDTVIIGGPLWGLIASHVHDDIDTVVQARRVLAPVHPIEVVGSHLGPEVGAVGGACLVLSHALSPRTASLLLGG